jgi:hypothetical protein
MLIIRDIFTAKPGQASKLAKLFKKSFGTEPNTRVMTDLIGEYNTVVIETQAASLSEFERHMEEYKAGMQKMDPDVQRELSKYTEMYVTGKREILQIID